MLFKASAPGSLMLLGEYAVLHGKHALTCAVNKRITVTLEPRQDQQIEIISPSLGSSLTTHVSQLTVKPPFQFVLAALQQYQKKLSSGCTLTIESEFSDKVGLGSSAAVTVATLAALNAWLSLSLSAEPLIHAARAVIQSVQGVGSGADVAACVMGGVVAYRMQPFLVETLSWEYPLTVIYSGFKTPTVEAIQHVTHVFAAHPLIFKQLMQSIDACVIQGIASIQSQQWDMLGKIMNIQQGLMESLGVNTPLLGGIVNILRQKSGILGAKISGSGLGDCIIGLGAVAHDAIEFTDQTIRQIAIEVSPQGVKCE